ncbi:MAG: histidine kinase [Burkholderiales bacterium]|nr:histidine kinase [Burkholderiales bacterium]
MRLTNKILLSIFLVSIIVITITTFVYYALVKQHLENSFDTRYNSLGTSISNSFIEMDKLSDTINYNAVKSLFLIEKYQGLPNDTQLNRLAKEFGIHGFYTINKLGQFIRSSDLPIALQKNSLFSYCPAYRGLINGTSTYQVTPIIPSYPHNIPAKLIMIPNHNSTLILEGGYHLKFIEEILLKTIKNNKNIISIGLYSPNNYELGYINNKGKFEQGKTASTSSNIAKNEKMFKYKILANTKDCCECIVKKTQYLGGAYYYDLVIKVSTQSLLKELYQIKIKILLILLFMFLIAFIVSQIIAKKIANRLGEINTSIENIIQTGDLSNNVVVMKSGKAHKDEIDSLATSFNHMIEELKIYQQKVQNTAVAAISSKIVHNIRSPLIVLDTIAKKLNHPLDNSSISLLKNAIKDIKTLSEKLLLTYRNSAYKNIDNENIDLAGYITISSMINEVFALKSVEWAGKIIDVPIIIAQECIFSWVKVVPADFRAVLSNLVNNSYEALNKPAKFIKVSLTSEDNYYKIVIQDNGKGIPQNKLIAVKSGESLCLLKIREQL